MSPEGTSADISQFTAVDRVSDPAAMIGMLDRLKSLLRGPKDTLLDRLSLEHARMALDVGCGTGGDVVEMAGRMPPESQAAGLDASEAMIAEARRRHEGGRHGRGRAAAGAGVTFRLGDALGLPYPDGTFDVCRTETVLQHIRDARQAVAEMARVTAPGGRVGALEFDQGSAMLDHPDQQTTRVILNAFSDSMACGLIGRQLPRLFRHAGLTDVSVDPFVILGTAQAFRALLAPVVTRLHDERVLTGEQANQWWATFSGLDDDGDFLGGSTVFVVTGTRPR
jgi:ubiquinone/menaquinone biosynthesis C-methylase UbiE